MSGPSDSGTVLVTCRTHVLFKNVHTQPRTATLPNLGVHKRPPCCSWCAPRPAVRGESQRTLLLEPSVWPSRPPCHTLRVGRRALRKRHVFGDMKCPPQTPLYSSRSPQGPDPQRPRTCTAVRPAGRTALQPSPPGEPRTRSRPEPNGGPGAKPRVRPARVRPRRPVEGLLTTPHPRARLPRPAGCSAARRGASAGLGPRQRGGGGARPRGAPGAARSQCSLGGAQAPAGRSPGAGPGRGPGPIISQAPARRTGRLSARDPCARGAGAAESRARRLCGAGAGRGAGALHFPARKYRGPSSRRPGECGAAGRLARPPRLRASARRPQCRPLRARCGRRVTFYSGLVSESGDPSECSSGARG